MCNACSCQSGRLLQLNYVCFFFFFLFFLVDTFPVELTPTSSLACVASACVKGFGLGLNTSNMVGAYAIVVDGNGNVTERLLAYEGNGNKLLPPSVTVLSSTVENGRRVVWVRIPASSNNAHLSYNQLLQDGKLPIIVAAGNGAVFAYHKYKTAAQVTLAGVGVPSCIVSGGPSDVPFGKGKGTILYTPPAGEPGTPTSHVLGANTTNLGFNKDCLPYPKSVMLLQKNAECDIRTYTGGQSCCHHLFTLLDKNQTTPWQDKPLEYVWHLPPPNAPNFSFSTTLCFSFRFTKLSNWCTLCCTQCMLTCVALMVTGAIAFRKVPHEIPDLV